VNNFFRHYVDEVQRQMLMGSDRILRKMWKTTPGQAFCGNISSK
jgi:hypothetical protein